MLRRGVLQSNHSLTCYSLHGESCKGSEATKEYRHFPKVEGDRNMVDVVTGLLLVALIGGGFLRCVWFL